MEDNFIDNSDKSNTLEFYPPYKDDSTQSIDNMDDNQNFDDYQDYDEYQEGDIIEDDASNDNDKIKTKTKNKNKRIFSESSTIEFNNKIQAIKYLFNDVNFMDVLVRLFASYFIVVFRKTAIIEEKFFHLEFGTNIDVRSFIIQIILVFVILSLVKYLVNNPLKSTLNTDGYVLGVSIMLYGFLTVFRLNNFYYALGVSIVVSTVMIFLVHNDYFKEFKKLSKWETRTIVGVLFLCFVGYVGTLCIYRYLSYTTSCFDFGIFCQMYYYMVNHGLSVDTTCERNELLSHFAIHVSPIYYLLLPVFAIFQSPKTLLICQAIIVASGVIPLYLICKNFKFSNASTIGFCAMFIFSPALITSTFFDFHENKFLVPLILWLFWAIETGHIKLMYLFIALTLFVKEDAFIYVASISLFVIFSKKSYYNKKKDTEKSLLLHGIIMLAVSLIYFFVISKLMEKYGNGVMEYRYSNVMMNPDAGLLNVVKTIALNPALAIYEAFTEDKMLFFLQMTVPLLFLPLLNKKISHVFLLIPFFLVNLISDYPYQTQIGYQYVCGVMSMLIYLSVLNMHEMKIVPKRYIATACMCTSMIMGVMYGSDKLLYYDSYNNYYGRIMRMNNLLSYIPQDASVECTTYFVPQLSQRDELYMLEDKEVKYEPTDFIAIRVGSGEENYTDEKLSWIQDNGYEFYNGYSDLMYVFVKSEYIEQHPELREHQRLQPIMVEN
ncbi:MAG: DUF2079 domain-containing protein [Oscillospiraceae bacterium]